MTGVDPGAAGRFLETAFERRDWVAIFLKSSARHVQRPGGADEAIELWKRIANGRHYGWVLGTIRNWLLTAA